jgi:hypothetical protein
VFEFGVTSTSFLIDTSGFGGVIFSNTVHATFDHGESVPAAIPFSVNVAVLTKAVAVGEPTTPYKVTVTGPAFNNEVIFVAGKDVAEVCDQPLILYADRRNPLFVGKTSLNIVLVTGHHVFVIVI